MKCNMIEKFLKAKHWQMFLLTFGIPMIFQLTLFVGAFLKLESGYSQEPSFLSQSIVFFPLMMLLYTVVFFGWFWSVGIGLQSKIPDSIQMKVKRFKIFFFSPLVYILFFLGFFMSSIGRFGPDPAMLTVIFPLHLFSMFCMFYILYFVAKTIKTVELQREVSFSDFVGEFFLIWFYPIGVWIIQAKINKMVEE